MHFKFISFILPIAAIVAIVGCNTNKNKDTSAAVSDEMQANTNYKPAFAGQTRIKSIVTATPYKVEKLAEKLGRPWAIIPLPDGRLMITENQVSSLYILPKAFY